LKIACAGHSLHEKVRILAVTLTVVQYQFVFYDNKLAEIKEKCFTELWVLVWSLTFHKFRSLLFGPESQALVLGVLFR